MAEVKFESITASYGKKTVLKDFSLTVNSNEILCLVGPSGCGKTTLVRCLLGLMKPESGVITVGDRVLFDAKKRINVPAEKRNIGIVFQDYAVWPHMTVIENVSYPLKKRRVPKEEIRERAMKALELVHMEMYANHLPMQLSGGQQQRVAIARAVIGEPEIILADEPTGNLDAASGAEIMQLFKRLNQEKGITILQVTHSAETASYSSRIVTLKDRVII